MQVSIKANEITRKLLILGRHLLACHPSCFRGPPAANWVARCSLRTPGGDTVRAPDSLSCVLDARKKSDSRSSSCLWDSMNMMNPISSFVLIISWSNACAATNSEWATESWRWIHQVGPETESELSSATRVGSGTSTTAGRGQVTTGRSLHVWSDCGRVTVDHGRRRFRSRATRAVPGARQLTRGLAISSASADWSSEFCSCFRPVALWAQRSVQTTETPALKDYADTCNKSMVE